MPTSLVKLRPSESVREFRRSRSSISTTLSRSRHETLVEGVAEAVEAVVRVAVHVAAAKVVVITVLEAIEATEALTEETVEIGETETPTEEVEVALTPVARLCLSLTALLSLLSAGNRSLVLTTLRRPIPEKSLRRTTKGLHNKLQHLHPV